MMGWGSMWCVCERKERERRRLAAGVTQTLTAEARAQEQRKRIARRTKRAGTDLVISVSVVPPQHVLHLAICAAGTAVTACQRNGRQAAGSANAPAAASGREGRGGGARGGGAHLRGAP